MSPTWWRAVLFTIERSKLASANLYDTLHIKISFLLPFHPHFPSTNSSAWHIPYPLEELQPHSPSILDQTLDNESTRLEQRSRSGHATREYLMSEALILEFDFVLLNNLLICIAWRVGATTEPSGWETANCTGLYFWVGSLLVSVIGSSEPGAILSEDMKAKVDLELVIFQTLRV